jgi:hypothetical protein
MISYRAAIFMALVSALLYTYFPSFSSPLAIRNSRQVIPVEDRQRATPIFFDENQLFEIPSSPLPVVEEPEINPDTNIPKQQKPVPTSTTKKTTSGPSTQDTFSEMNTPITWLILSIIMIVLIFVLTVILCALRYTMKLPEFRPSYNIDDIEPDSEWVGDPVPRYKNKGSPESEVDLPIYYTVEEQEQELQNDPNGVDIEGEMGRSSGSIFPSRDEVMNLTRQ